MFRVEIVPLAKVIGGDKITFSSVVKDKTCKEHNENTKSLVAGMGTVVGRLGQAASPFTALASHRKTGMVAVSGYRGPGEVW